MRFCDAFNVPIVTFEDVPGFLPGVDSGARRHHPSRREAALRILPRRPCRSLTVITRKAYGGAYVVMNSRGVRADIVYAWPTAEIAVMGARGAVNVIHRRDIAASDDPDEERTRLIDDYEDRFANPYVAAERGLVDDVIEPRATRPHLIRSLDMLRNKREAMPPKKHGNIPL